MKMRRFNGEDDSYVEGTATSLRDDTEDQLRQVNTERMARMARGESADAPAAEPAAAGPVAAAPKPQNFKSAFADARSAGDKTFEFGGKKYTTDLAKPSIPTAAPKADDKEAEYQKAEEAAKSSEGKAKRAAMEKSQAIENVYPEQALLGGAGFGIKSIAKAAQNLANRGGAKEVAKRIEPTFRETEKQLALSAPAKRLALPAPAKQVALPAPPSKLALPAPPSRLALPAPPRGASAAESTKAKLAGELRRGAQPTKFTSPSKSATSKKTRKFNEDEGGVEFRRGGSVSSASKRADGCAIRGKTRA